nr:cytochrome c [Novosphingobium piscinae]
MAAAVVAFAGGTRPAAVSAQDKPGNKAAVEPASAGRELYEQICQACHMPDAKGGMGAGTGVPALAGNAHLADKTFVIARVWHGYGGMPRFGALLSPEQVAAVTTYVRSHFNAYPDPVTVEEVAKVADGAPPQVACNCTH